jgi:hypothetical protein
MTDLVLCDVRTALPLTEPLFADGGLSGAVEDLSAAPAAGTRLAIGGLDAMVWTLDPRWWRRTACGVVGRGFIRAEWDRWIGDQLRYRKDCPAG